MPIFSSIQIKYVEELSIRGGQVGGIIKCILKMELYVEPLVQISDTEQDTIRNMNLTQISKQSSSLSFSPAGCTIMLPGDELEKKVVWTTATRDLFDLLLDENCCQVVSQDIVEESNASPLREQAHGCRCSKIDCLKMYCECFSKGLFCTQLCECVCCCNKVSCKAQIVRAQQIVNLRQPGTFTNVSKWVPARRCTCKKSECKKNYCDCYRMGMKCTAQCGCLDCQNGKPDHQYCYEVHLDIEVNA